MSEKRLDMVPVEENIIKQFQILILDYLEAINTTEHYISKIEIKYCEKYKQLINEAADFIKNRYELKINFNKACKRYNFLSSMYNKDIKELEEIRKPETKKEDQQKNLDIVLDRIKENIRIIKEEIFFKF